MKERTLQILTALIEDFVETASPIASKHLLEAHKDFDISSATVRNEFSLLEEVGLIESPHISAGKVPTQKGYRFFVDELLAEKSDKIQQIQTIFEKRIAQYRFAKTKEMLFDALRLLAQLSGNIAFATTDNDRTFYLGLSNVLRSPEFLQKPEQAARIVEILEGREKFQQLLQTLDLPSRGVKIFIGDENILEEISSCAMIVARFSSEFVSGYMGILGPMRMRYGFNRALIGNALAMIE